MYYVFDACEMIMGPFESYKEASNQLELFVTECYLLEDYPNPYVDFMEDYDESLGYVKREKIIRRKKLDA